MLSLPIALALVSAGPSDADVKKAIESSIAYLADDAVDWVRTMRCASCHHAPMAVWSLREAKARGFAVDEEALGELVKVTVEDPVSSKLLPPEKEKPTPDSFAYSATYGSIASRAVTPPSE